MQGDVQVAISEVFIDYVTVESLRSQSQSQKPLFQIRISLRNIGQNRKIEYSGWSESGSSFSTEYARLSDNFDNRYKRINFGFSADVVGQVDNESIYPGKKVTDLLIFELPLDTVEYLQLELPANAFGGEGFIRFQIPRSMMYAR